MTLLDAYALIAFVTGGPASGQVRAHLREGNAALATVNLVEALDVCRRVRGLPIPRALEVIEPLFDTALALIELDRARARRAAEIRAEHYHRSTCPISLADAVLLASVDPSGRIATADPDVLAVASAEGLDAIALSEQG